MLDSRTLCLLPSVHCLNERSTEHSIGFYGGLGVLSSNFPLLLVFGQALEAQNPCLDGTLPPTFLCKCTDPWRVVSERSRLVLSARGSQTGFPSKPGPGLGSAAGAAAHGAVPAALVVPAHGSPRPGRAPGGGDPGGGFGPALWYGQVRWVQGVFAWCVVCFLDAHFGAASMEGNERRTTEIYMLVKTIISIAQHVSRTFGKVKVRTNYIHSKGSIQKAHASWHLPLSGLLGVSKFR